MNNLTELAQVVPLGQLDIADDVKQVDFKLMIKEKKKVEKPQIFSHTKIIELKILMKYFETFS